MAIYHFSGTVISRGQGRTAIAAAAYRAGEKLHDERQDQVLDYSRKKDVLYKEILLPANAPVWMSDRAKLWNAVEQSENRKDSQLAREVQFTLPRELSKEQNIELAREFVQTQFVARGMVADLCMHVGKAKDGEDQPHAHVMLTMREITTEGFGLKERSWNDKANYMLWREAWAEHANKYLALNGIDQKIDHRSYAEQGIDLIPQNKIGPQDLPNYERRLEEHRQIAQENGQRIFDDPTIALDAITRQQATFTHRDLARFANRHTVDAEQFQLVYEKLKAAPQIVSLGHDAKNQERFTTKEMLAIETKMFDEISALQNSGHAVQAERSSDIDNFSVSSILTEQQQEALEHITNPGDIKCLIGYAGTGKSCLLNEARAIWEASGYQVQGATLAGIAAENLENASGITSKTVASVFYQWGIGNNLTSKDILIIDEAGMLGTRQLARIIAEVNAHSAKLVLLGDPQQLQAIEAGGAFRAASVTTGYAELTEVRRQQITWQQQATKEFATGNIPAAIKRYDEHDHLHQFDTQATAKLAMVEMWQDVRMAQPEQIQLMLAYTTKDVQELNEIARDFRKQNNELGPDQILATASGNKPFAIGDRIYFLRNNRDLGVMNGTLGTIEHINETRLTVLSDKDNINGNSDGEKRISFDLASYDHITHGYAATIHKAQGVTVDRSYLLASKYLDSHAIYVGMSRHRISTDLFYSKEEFVTEQSLLYTLSRNRSKELSLDYCHGVVGKYSLDGALLAPNQDYTNELGCTLASEYHEAPSSQAPLTTTANNLTIIDQYKILEANYIDAYQKTTVASNTNYTEFKDCFALEKAALMALKQYTHTICKDLSIIKAIKQNDVELFNKINQRFDSILTKTLQQHEHHELLVQKYPELNQTIPHSSRVNTVIAQYKVLQQDYTNKYQQTEIASNTSSQAFKQCFADEKIAKDELTQYAQAICQDIAITKLISQQEPQLFTDMNQQFNNIFTKVLNEQLSQEQFIQMHPELRQELPKEAKIDAIFTQYQELKNTYLELSQSKNKENNFTDFNSKEHNARDNLNHYAYEIGKDKDLMGYLKESNETIYNEIQEKFNELEQKHLEQMQDLQKEIER